MTVTLTSRVNPQVLQQQEKPRLDHGYQVIGKVQLHQGQEKMDRGGK